MESIRKQLVNLFPDDAGAVVQDVVKGFVFPVEVAHEMLGSFGKVDNGLKIDDLGNRRFLGRKLPRQDFQISSVFFIGHGHDTSACLSFQK